jgi:hypothetical protein
METQEGPRKRKRSDAVTEDADATAASIPADLDAEPIVRDEIYYRENGDCVILVGRVLFKVREYNPVVNT